MKQAPPPVDICVIDTFPRNKFTENLVIFSSPFFTNLALFLSEGIKRRIRAANGLPSLEPFVLFMGEMTLIGAVCVG